MASFIGYPTNPAHRQENGLNGVIVSGVADAAAALAAAIAAKPNGSTSDASLNGWTFSQIQAGNLTLPGSATVVWCDGFHNVGASGRVI